VLFAIATMSIDCVFLKDINKLKTFIMKKTLLLSFMFLVAIFAQAQTTIYEKTAFVLSDVKKLTGHNPNFWVASNFTSINTNRIYLENGTDNYLTSPVMYLYSGVNYSLNTTIEMNDVAKTTEIYLAKFNGFRLEDTVSKIKKITGINGTSAVNESFSVPTNGYYFVKYKLNVSSYKKFYLHNFKVSTNDNLTGKKIPYDELIDEYIDGTSGFGASNPARIVFDIDSLFKISNTEYAYSPSMKFFPGVKYLLEINTTNNSTDVPRKNPYEVFFSTSSNASGKVTSLIYDSLEGSFFVEFTVPSEKNYNLIVKHVGPQFNKYISFQGLKIKADSLVVVAAKDYMLIDSIGLGNGWTKTGAQTAITYQQIKFQQSGAAFSPELILLKGFEYKLNYDFEQNGHNLFLYLVRPHDLNNPVAALNTLTATQNDVNDFFNVSRTGRYKLMFKDTATSFATAYIRNLSLSADSAYADSLDADNNGPNVTISLNNGATLVPVDTTIKFYFNETIYANDNSWIANPQSFIEIRKDNATGANFTNFTATLNMTGDTLVVDITGALLYGTNYYINSLNVKDAIGNISNNTSTGIVITTEDLPTSLINADDNSDLIVFPNPSNGNINIAHATEGSFVTIWNTNGQQIESVIIKESGLASFFIAEKGLFILSITDKNKTSYRKISVK